jgi:hypothetical protein
MVDNEPVEARDPEQSVKENATGPAVNRSFTRKIGQL